MPVTTAATFCATLVEEWVRAGVTDAVVAPGSRSTPLALALAAEPALRVHVHHDERSASFLALGLGLATGRPAVLLCTSGTAAAHFHAAVIEAHQASVPMVVCTADRPPELRDVAAPQTIDQSHLYGGAVRWYADPGVPDEAMRTTWRSLAARAVLDATGPSAGPVHLNLPFRDPLVGDAGPLPPARQTDADAWHTDASGMPLLGPDAVGALAARLDHHRGVIVMGGGGGDPEVVHRLAAAVQWPVLADPRSGGRLPLPTTVGAFDGVLRHAAFAADHTPAVVLRLGHPPASKVLSQWLAASGALQVQVGASGWIDPEHSAAVRVSADPTDVCHELAKRMSGASGTPWLARWQRADERAQDAIDAVVANAVEPTEPGIARRLLAALPAGATLVASSSMPIRDVEWYGRPRDGVRVVANRGANGIDGVVSTAVGVALAGGPTALLVGDVALLHDSNGLLGAARRDVDLTIVCIDNDGGGIFSFLPQAAALAPERFEQLFGTPHGVDLGALAAAHGVPTVSWEGLDEALAGGPGARLVLVRTERAANVAVHDRINRAIAAAL